MQWLQEIFDRMLSIFPRIRIVTTYEAAVMFTFGKHKKSLGSGWYLQWPWFQDFVYMEVQSQAIDLRCQSAHTSDGVDVAVGGGIQYRITDIEKAVCNVMNIDESIGKIALGTILKYVNMREFNDCHNVEELEAEVLKGLREAARGWGVKIERVFITDFGKTINVRLLGGIPNAI